MAYHPARAASWTNAPWHALEKPVAQAVTNVEVSDSAIVVALGTIWVEPDRLGKVADGHSVLTLVGIGASAIIVG